MGAGPLGYGKSAGSLADSTTPWPVLHCIPKNLTKNLYIGHAHPIADIQPILLPVDDQPPLGIPTTSIGSSR